MSPRERSAWIRLLSILIVFIPYFLHVVALFGTDGPIARPLCTAFVVAAVAHAILNGIAQALSQGLLRCELIDERDRAIDAQSLRVAYFLLIVSVLLAISTIAVLGWMTAPTSAGTILQPTYSVASQYVLACIVLAEASRHVVQVVRYRQAAA